MAEDILANLIGKLKDKVVRDAIEDFAFARGDAAILIFVNCFSLGYDFPTDVKSRFSKEELRHNNFPNDGKSKFPYDNIEIVKDVTSYDSLVAEVLKKRSEKPNYIAFVWKGRSDGFSDYVKKHAYIVDLEENLIYI